MAHAICENCGVSFSIKWPRNPNRFCSPSCRSKFTTKTHPLFLPSRVKVPCARCGTVRLVTPSRRDQGARFYCSKPCADADKKLLTGPDHPLYKPKVPMACEVCGTVRLVKPSLIYRYRACSRRCACVLGQIQHPRRSSIELAVESVLTEIGESFTAQAVFHWYTVDFFLPDRALVIECDGTYWHSTARQQRLDHSKDSYLRKRGITVVRLPEEAIKADARAAVAHALNNLSRQNPSD